MSDSPLLLPTCTNCGKPLIEGNNFCAKCGKVVGTPLSSGLALGAQPDPETAFSTVILDSSLSASQPTDDDTNVFTPASAMMFMNTSEPSELSFQSEGNMSIQNTASGASPENTSVDAFRRTSEVLSAVVMTPALEATTQWVPGGTRPLLLFEIATRLDAWFDLLENQGHKAKQLEEAFREKMLMRQFPGLRYEIITYQSASVPLQKRPYLLISRTKGGMMNIYISQLGNDLYLAWDLLVRYSINWSVMAVIAVLSIMCGPLFIWQGFHSPIFAFISFMINAIVFGVIVAFIGKFIRNNYFAFFVNELNDFDIQDLRALRVATDMTLRQVSDTLGIQSLREKNYDFSASNRSGRTI